MAKLEVSDNKAPVAAVCEVDGEAVVAEAAGENLFFHRCMMALSIILVLSAIVFLKRFRYELPLAQSGEALSIVPCLAAAGYCWWAKWPRLLEACLLAGWACILSSLLKFPMYLAARSGVSLKDGQLAHLDRLMGFDVPSIVKMVSSHPRIGAILLVSYDLLLPLMILAAVVPAVRYRFTAAKEYIVATSFATFAGAPLFALFPAIGPWASYALAPSAVQRQCEALLLELHSNRLHVIDLNESGIVCFPSFHALLAILSAVALWSIRPLRAPVVLVACLVVASTLTTGWHYGVDVVAGVLLAAASVGAAKLFSRMEASFSAAR